MMPKTMKLTLNDACHRSPDAVKLMLHLHRNQSGAVQWADGLFIIIITSSYYTSNHANVTIQISY